jgi:DNA (cytosine-5)-methyltransferase 1
MTHAGYFEGIGGFSLGAERAGIETIYTCEIDDFKYEHLKRILPNAKHERDITTAIGCYADVFTAGFPCQDISRANPKGKGLKGERSGLFYPFVKLVGYHKPMYVVLENSPMLISTREILDILREFAILGYDAEWQVISKRPFSYPDERERLILIAYRNEVGREKSKPLFESESFEKCVKTQRQNEFIQHKLSRRNPAADWIKFITKSLQADAGIPKELAAKQIACYGDAICPDVAQLAFELIKVHE